MMKGVLDRYAREFTALQPNVRFDISLNGSEEAIPALTSGTADLGVMDRDLTDNEATSFVTVFGVPPTTFQTAIDCEAIVVQEGNPLAAGASGVTLAQLDGIYSKTLKRGGPAVTTWGDLGVTDANWAGQTIAPYYRPSAEPSYLSIALFDGGELKDGLTDPGAGEANKVLAGRPSMEVAPTQDSNGVQLVPRVYLDQGLADKTLHGVCLIDANANHVRPFYTNVLTGSYPLGTILTFRAVKTPTQPLSPAVKEFLAFVLSKEGQKVIPRSGFGRLPVPMILSERTQLE